MQQIYALRYHRFEVNPYFGLTMNDQFVGHNGPGLAAQLVPHQRPRDRGQRQLVRCLNTPSDFNFQTSRAARIGEPITEYQWNANANFTYVPACGKFVAGFSDFIFHYDFFVLGGGGAISTRPMAVVVIPTTAPSTGSRSLPFHVGGGLRIFFQPLVCGGVRGQRLHLLRRAREPSVDRNNPQDKSTLARRQGRGFTNNVQAQVGCRSSCRSPGDTGCRSEDFGRGDAQTPSVRHRIIQPKTGTGMMRRFVQSLCTVVAGLTGCALLMTAAPAEAQEIQLTGPLAGAPAVRKLRLHRDGRLRGGSRRIVHAAGRVPADDHAGPAAHLPLHGPARLRRLGRYGAQYNTGLTDGLTARRDRRA